MAQVATAGHPTSTINTSPIIKQKLRPWATPQISFDPEKHLNYTANPKSLSLKDIGIAEDAGISPFGVSDPFALFSEEAVRIMRAELFTTEVWEDCHFSTDFAGCQIRGHCPSYTPFMHAAWTHPKTLEIISTIAGIDLIPQLDYEIGNINVSVTDPADIEAKRTKDNVAGELPVTKWHTDSYPFVCVVMLSDASNMVGGETAVKTGSGEVLKVRGPQMGSAVVLQGRCITHQALGAMGGSERITMITAFRARDPFVADDSILTTIRPISNHDELYFQWTQYRIDVLQQRLDGMKRLLEEQHREKRPTDIKRIKEFLKAQAGYLAITEREIQ